MVSYKESQAVAQGNDYEPQYMSSVSALRKYERKECLSMSDVPDRDVAIIVQWSAWSAWSAW